MIGGQTRDKKDCQSIVLFGVKLPQPNLTVRYHAGLDARFRTNVLKLAKLDLVFAFNDNTLHILISKVFLKMITVQLVV